MHVERRTRAWKRSSATFLVTTVTETSNADADACVETRLKRARDAVSVRCMRSAAVKLWARNGAERRVSQCRKWRSGMEEGNGNGRGIYDKVASV